MNYQAHYDRLIERAQNRTILQTSYKEMHHIVPKCMGGTDDVNNLVELFAEEHLIAHLLLSKIYPNNEKLLHSVFRMSQIRRYTNKEYGWLRQKYSSYMKTNNPMFNENIRKKMSNSRKGKLVGNENPSKREDVRETLSKAVAKSWENADERKKAFSEKFSGSNNPASKLYHITDPNGILYVVDGTLEKFTNSNGLSINILRNWVNRGIIQRTSKKDITFFRDESKRKLMGWKIDEINKV